MAMNDALNDREAHACSFKLGLSVQALEHTEQRARMFHVEPCAIVADKINAFSLFHPAADLNPRSFFSPGEFEGIGEKINDGLLEQSQIADAVGNLFELQLHLAIGLLGAQFVKHLADEAGKV